MQNCKLPMYLVLNERPPPLPTPHPPPTPPTAAVLLELCQSVDDATLVALISGSQAPLAAWLVSPASEATPEALLLALRLWPRLPAPVAEACPLLPAGFRGSLPAQLFQDPAASAGKGVAAAAAAFFTRRHLAELLPVLRASTHSNPRLHSVWPTLLALLIPGFSADKVPFQLPRC